MAACQYRAISSTTAGSRPAGSSYSGPSTVGSGAPSRTLSSSARTRAGGLAATWASSSASTPQGRVEGGNRNAGRYRPVGASAASSSSRSPPSRPRVAATQRPYISWRPGSCSTRRLATSSSTGEWANRTLARSLWANLISIMATIVPTAGT